MNDYGELLCDEEIGCICGAYIKGHSHVESCMENHKAFITAIDYMMRGKLCITWGYKSFTNGVTFLQKMPTLYEDPLIIELINLEKELNEDYNYFESSISDTYYNLTGLETSEKGLASLRQLYHASLYTGSY